MLGVAVGGAQLVEHPHELLDVGAVLVGQGAGALQEEVGGPLAGGGGGEVGDAGIGAEGELVSMMRGRIEDVAAGVGGGVGAGVGGGIGVGGCLLLAGAGVVRVEVAGRG